MSLDTVVEDISNEAHARAENLCEDGEARAEEIISAAEDDAEELLAEAQQEVDREIEQRREQRRSSAKLEAKQERLEARRDVLSEVRTAVEDELASLGGETREKLTRALLGDASSEFENGDAVRVYGAADDEVLLESILEEYYNYEYAGEVDCLGGVVLESDQSRVRVNNTFDSVLEDVWEENLQEISTRLFEQ